MENKINIAELLKDCPKGMELDCILFNNPVKYESANDDGSYPISIRTEEGKLFYLNKYGCLYNRFDSKCAIFPKGKTTWEGFQRPFEDGDIVATNEGTWIGIVVGGYENEVIPTYCVIQDDGKFEAYFNKKEKWAFDRLATEEEKEKLFQAIKDNGYQWNAKTKTLEKLTEQKFDITTLKPFDKVLVRQNNNGIWGIDLFGFYNEWYYHTTGNCIYVQCVPYEQNEHLLGKTDDCDDYYKTW